MAHRAAQHPLTPRWPFASAVVIAHAIVLAPVLNPTVQSGREVRSPQDSQILVADFISPAHEPLDTLPIPEVKLDDPPLDLSSLDEVQFEADDWGNISGVTSSASAPQLSRFQPVDPAVFAKHAGLRSGEAASVVLTVEVRPDGTVGTIEVASGYGDPRVDAAAVAYARGLRWIPGTRDHVAESMRVRLPVVLMWRD